MLCHLQRAITGFWWTNGDPGVHPRLLLLLPFHRCHMLSNLLPTFQPCGHLHIFILVVCRMVRVLRKVNVQSLCLLRILVVHGSKELDRRLIVKETVQFWNVKVPAGTKINKDHLIIMEQFKRVLKTAKRVGCVAWELGKI